MGQVFTSARPASRWRRGGVPVVVGEGRGPGQLARPLPRHEAIVRPPANHAACIGAVDFRGADVTPIDGTWLVGGRVAIDVFDCQGLLCGRVAWLRRAALRTPELCGATIVYGLKSTGPTQWAGGTFIDPEDGHPYDLTATLQADGRSRRGSTKGSPCLENRDPASDPAAQLRRLVLTRVRPVPPRPCADTGNGARSLDRLVVRI